MSENTAHTTKFRTVGEYSKDFPKTNEGKVIDEFDRVTTLLKAVPIGEANGVLENRGERKYGQLHGKWVSTDEGGNTGRLFTEPFRDDLGSIEMWHYEDLKQQLHSPGHQSKDNEDMKDIARGLALDVEDALVYANGTKSFRGVMSYFPNISGAADLESPNFYCLNGAAKTAFGSHADSTSSLSGSKYASMLILVMGEDGLHMTYPLGAQNIGLMVKREKEFKEVNVNGESFFRRSTMFHWTVGLSIAHRCAAIRIANIDVSDPANAIPKLEERLYQALDLIPTHMVGRAQVYTTGKVIEGFRLYRNSKVTAIGDYKDTVPQNALGDIVFDNVVIHRTKAMVNTEAPVLAAA
jgi:hypothetical protein